MLFLLTFHWAYMAGLATVKLDGGEEIETAIVQGELLEDYPNDPRGESCLVLGYAGIKPIRVVLGWALRKDENRKIPRPITVYIPKPPKWQDPRTRGQRS